MTVVIAPRQQRDCMQRESQLRPRSLHHPCHCTHTEVRVGGVRTSPRQQISDRRQHMSFLVTFSLANAYLAQDHPPAMHVWDVCMYGMYACMSCVLVHLENERRGAGRVIRQETTIRLRVFTSIVAERGSWSSLTFTDFRGVRLAFVKA